MIIVTGIFCFFFAGFGPPQLSIPENCARELNITLLASEWSSSMGGLSTLNRKLAVLLAKQPHVNVTVLVPQNACSEEDKKSAS